MFRAVTVLRTGIDDMGLKIDAVAQIWLCADYRDGCSRMLFTQHRLCIMYEQD